MCLWGKWTCRKLERKKNTPHKTEWQCDAQLSQKQSGVLINARVYTAKRFFVFFPGQINRTYYSRRFRFRRSLEKVRFWRVVATHKKGEIRNACLKVTDKISKTPVVRHLSDPILRVTFKQWHHNRLTWLRHMCKNYCLKVRYMTCMSYDYQ